MKHSSRKGRKRTRRAKKSVILQILKKAFKAIKKLVRLIKEYFAQKATVDYNAEKMNKEKIEQDFLARKAIRKQKKQHRKKKEKKHGERISEKAIIHSSLGEFSQGDKKHIPRLLKGGHGEENLRELKRRGIEYDILKQYPNGVRIGNVSNHKNRFKREFGGQTWFPKDWNRNTIRKAGEKIVYEEKEKKGDGDKAIGVYKNVAVCVIRTNGKVATIFPYHKQSGGKNNG